MLDMKAAKQYNPSESPEQWVIIEIKDEKTDTPLYKVFGSWLGGYLDGDRWRMNSGITSVEEAGDYYYFFGETGSCYQCPKKRYGTGTSYTSGVLQNLIDTVKKLDNGHSITIVPQEEVNKLDFFQTEKLK